MSQLLALYDYWDSYKKGKPDQKLANQIKASLESHELHVSTALTFVTCVAAEAKFSAKSIEDTVAIYEGIGLDDFEECGLSGEILGEFLTEASKYNLDGSDALINATTTWNIFKSVDDENPLKKAILHYTFDSIAFYGFYNDVEIVNLYSEYVHAHAGNLLGLPVAIATSSPFLGRL